MDGRSVWVIRYIRGKVVVIVKERQEGLKYCNSNYTSDPKKHCFQLPLGMDGCEGLFSPRGTVTEISNAQKI